MADEPTPQEVNGALIDMFERGMKKEAQEAVNDYVRMKMREDGIMREVLPPLSITKADLDKQHDTDKLVKVCEKEPDSPAAYSVPFGALPNNRYIKGRKFRVMFQRLETPRFVKDIAELMSYDQDIRQIMSDNSLKDMQAEEDVKFIATSEAICVGQNQVNPLTGVVQWVTIADSITRDSWNEGLKVLRRTPGKFGTSTAVINSVSVLDFQKWGRDEAGGDIAEQIATDGFSKTNWFGPRTLVTIKRDLVPDNRIYHYAQPKALGKFYILDDVTMFVDTKAYMIEFFSYALQGAAIANASSVGIVDYTGSGS